MPDEPVVTESDSPETEASTESAAEEVVETAAETTDEIPSHVRIRLEAAERRAEEAEKLAEGWWKIAESRLAPKTKTEPENEEEEDETGNELISALNTGDPKRLKKVFSKMGYAPMKDVEETIQRRVRAELEPIQTLSAIQARYPDLANPQSEFTLAAKAEYEALEKDEVFSKLGQAKLIEIAAERAELKALRKGSSAKAKSDDGAAREAERLARVKAQGGGQRRDASSPVKTLTEDQKRAIEAYGISEADYLKTLNRPLRGRVKSEGRYQ